MIEESNHTHTHEDGETHIHTHVLEDGTTVTHSHPKNTDIITVMHRLRLY